MADDAYTSSTTTAWDDQQSSEIHTSSYGRPSFQSLDSVEEDPHHGPIGLTASPQPRSSAESAGKSPSLQPWRESHAAAFMDTLSSINTGQAPSLVEPTFDENVLRALCELDVSTLYSMLSYIFCPVSHILPLSSAVYHYCLTE